MLEWTEQERRTLALLGLAGLAALGVLAWRQRPLDFTQDAVLSEVEGQARSPLAIAGGASPAARAVRWERALDDARRLDVNTAGAAALERLPQVGPALARRIVEERRLHGRFLGPEELARVKGIGPKTVDALQDYVKGEE